MNRRAERDRLDFAYAGFDVLSEVGFAEDDDGTRAALESQNQVTLDAPQVVVVIEADDQKNGINVGRDDLLFGSLARRLARELTGARQHRFDDGAVLIRQSRKRHPVADRREIVAPLRRVAELASHFGEQLVALCEDAVQTLILKRDPRRLKAALAVSREGFFKVRV